MTDHRCPNEGKACFCTGACRGEHPPVPWEEYFTRTQGADSGGNTQGTD